MLSSIDSSLLLILSHMSICGPTDLPLMLCNYYMGSEAHLSALCPLGFSCFLGYVRTAAFLLSGKEQGPKGEVTCPEHYFKCIYFHPLAISIT